MLGMLQNELPGPLGVSDDDAMPDTQPAPNTGRLNYSDVYEDGGGIIGEVDPQGIVDFAVNATGPSVPPVASCSTT